MEKMKSINEPGYRVKAEESPKSLMPTYWLLKQEPEEREKEMNCAQDEQDCDNHCNLYVKYYDDTRADEMAQELEIYTAGPILVAFKMPYEYYQFHRKKPEEYLKFDLSDFSAEDIERAIRIWMERIAENPEMWDKGFRIEQIREVCQNFLNEYGSKILAAIKFNKD